mmetsp:Transcript_33815/g.77263  ORF Transcript_33815/g.77263 Transcript_33815/m.77263 type:complete len:1077 (-) Transcript_33815:6-3236(-)
MVEELADVAETVGRSVSSLVDDLGHALEATRGGTVDIAGHKVDVGAADVAAGAPAVAVLVPGSLLREIAHGPAVARTSLEAILLDAAAARGPGLPDSTAATVVINELHALGLKSEEGGGRRGQLLEGLDAGCGVHGVGVVGNVEDGVVAGPGESTHGEPAAVAVGAHEHILDTLEVLGDLQGEALEVAHVGTGRVQGAVAPHVLEAQSVGNLASDLSGHLGDLLDHGGGLLERLLGHGLDLARHAADLGDLVLDGALDLLGLPDHLLEERAPPHLGLHLGGIFLVDVQGLQVLVLVLVLLVSGTVDPVLLKLLQVGSAVGLLVLGTVGKVLEADVLGAAVGIEEHVLEVSGAVSTGVATDVHGSVDAVVLGGVAIQDLVLEVALQALVLRRAALAVLLEVLLGGGDVAAVGLDVRIPKPGVDAGREVGLTGVETHLGGEARKELPELVRGVLIAGTAGAKVARAAGLLLDLGALVGGARSLVEPGAVGVPRRRATDGAAARPAHGGAGQGHGGEAAERRAATHTAGAAGSAAATGDANAGDADVRDMEVAVVAVVVVVVAEEVRVVLPHPTHPEKEHVVVLRAPMGEAVGPTPGDGIAGALEHAALSGKLAVLGTARLSSGLLTHAALHTGVLTAGLAGGTPLTASVTALDAVVTSNRLVDPTKLLRHGRATSVAAHTPAKLPRHLPLAANLTTASAALGLLEAAEAAAGGALGSVTAQSTFLAAGGLPQGLTLTALTLGHLLVEAAETAAAPAAALLTALELLDLVETTAHPAAAAVATEHLPLSGRHAVIVLASVTAELGHLLVKTIEHPADARALRPASPLGEAGHHPAQVGRAAVLHCSSHEIRVLVQVAELALEGMELRALLLTAELAAQHAAEVVEGTTKALLLILAAQGAFDPLELPLLLLLHAAHGMAGALAPVTRPGGSRLLLLIILSLLTGSVGCLMGRQLLLESGLRELRGETDRGAEAASNTADQSTHRGGELGVVLAHVARVLADHSAVALALAADLFMERGILLILLDVLGFVLLVLRRNFLHIRHILVLLDGWHILHKLGCGGTHGQYGQKEQKQLVHCPT